MWGAGPPATWAFAIFLASDMLFLRLFPVVFGVFAFSQCDSKKKRTCNPAFLSASMFLFFSDLGRFVITKQYIFWAVWVILCSSDF